MGNFMKKTRIFIIALILTACGQSKIEVVSQTYLDGKPKTVRYFNSKRDSKEKIYVKHSNGIGTVSKPLTFQEEGYYENGKLEFRGSYINGETSGLWEYYYETGIQEARSYYHNGNSTDTVLCWYPSGKIKRNKIEIDTTKNYWYNIDFYENGRKYIECYQTKDSTNNIRLNGQFQEWYDSGQLKFSAVLKNDWTVGKWIKYELDGSLKEESEESFSIRYE